MNPKLNSFLDLFEEVAAGFKERGLESFASPDVVERVAVHLSISNERQAERGPGAVADGQEGTVTGILEATAKRQVSTKNGERTAFDITVSGQKYSTFDKKIFGAGIVVGKEVVVTFKQNGKFRNLVAISPKDAVEEKDPF